jgi:hypothetical protein
MCFESASSQGFYFLESFILSIIHSASSMLHKTWKNKEFVPMDELPGLVERKIRPALVLPVPVLTSEYN